MRCILHCEQPKGRHLLEGSEGTYLRRGAYCGEYSKLKGSGLGMDPWKKICNPWMYWNLQKCHLSNSRFKFQSKNFFVIFTITIIYGNLLLVQWNLLRAVYTFVKMGKIERSFVIFVIFGIVNFGYWTKRGNITCIWELIRFFYKVTEAPQASVKIKIYVNFVSSSGIRTGNVNPFSFSSSKLLACVFSDVSWTQVWFHWGNF